MAVSDTERAQEISRALSFYHKDFNDYLATTISLSEKIPEQVNNQIRNAMTHIARAHVAEDIGTLRDEVNKCISHIDRANRDCLKVSIITARLEFDELITLARFYRGTLTPNLDVQIRDLKDARKESYRAEADGSPDVVEKLDIVLRKTLFISEHLKSEYAISHNRLSKIKLFLYRFRAIYIAIIGAAVGLLIRFLIVTYYDSLSRSFTYLWSLVSGA